jgi:uncharacterized protein
MHQRNLLDTRVSLLITFLLSFLLTNCSRSLEKERRSLNKLANARSPYLVEHADNPVDWYEWGEDAREKARAENKPIIISIGYSSCHWCHVMEEESFMDTAVARIMNENFVSIKVDREERPDVDQIYVNAAQLISGSAGWPLNAFALPDGKPFYAGTYFTRDQWINMLMQIIDAYKNDNSTVVKQAGELTNGIQTQELFTSFADSTEAFQEKFYREIFGKWSFSLDEEYGGLAGVPKFPMPAIWEFMLQYHHLTGNKKSLTMVTSTLDRMVRGGLYDQLGGGFSRYSTDKNWKVPHFEKMLYDNAQLVSLYSHAYQVTKNPLYKDVVENTIKFVERELTSPAGGFYSSLNADSEGEEGKYYVWTQKEIENILDGKTAQLFTEYFQITKEGNWENKKNILYPEFGSERFLRKYNLSEAEWTKIISEGEEKLLEARSKRIRPATDDKILTSWNALMLIGYIDSYMAMGDQHYLEMALKNARFLEANVLRNEGALWRSYKGNTAAIEAFLDDYALLSKAFVCLYQVTFDVHWLQKARSLCDYAVEHFRDPTSGMFYYTPNFSKGLVVRKMEVADNVIPSSNSVMAEVLFLLGEYYQSSRYIQMSNGMLRQVSNEIFSGPFYANWARLRGIVTYKPFEIAVMGTAALEKGKELQQHYIPLAIFMGGSIENLPLLENKYVEGETMIYVCRNRVCKMPVRELNAALQQLKME